MAPGFDVGNWYIPPTVIRIWPLGLLSARQPRLRSKSPDAESGCDIRRLQHRNLRQMLAHIQNIIAPCIIHDDVIETYTDLSEFQAAQTGPLSICSAT